MTRTNCDPKEFMLLILNEHLKFLNRLKRRKIPDNYHHFVDEEKERTKQQIELVNKDLPLLIKMPNIVKKDHQILILEEQMNNLQVEYKECVNENLILTNQEKAVNKIFKIENQYINLYERLMSLINQDEGEDEGENEGEDEGEGEENEGEEDKNEKDEDERKWWRD
ncbi:hypothetical protein C2G38_2154653 [Gigaspora rosea]|uniref:Uncharacterized protein n=1 Tax=Gigaspora rosea TaxID=44941 RepID=A0A397W4P7_9GLOM|nr:hypothetical protein C2G38_2154653 [Gigaspora rosea]